MSNGMSNGNAETCPKQALARPIVIGRINGIGLFTLYRREVMRFLKIFGQTIAAPVVTTWLFMTVFVVAIGDRINPDDDTAFVIFLAPGLVMMTALQNAFASTSSSLVIGKMQGNIIDVIMPPLGPAEVFCAMTAAGITRGILVGVVTMATLVVFGIPILPEHALAAVWFLAISSAIMAVAGLITGLWADRFDSLAAVTNFMLQPLVFLSGTFYTIDRLPPPFETIALYNPVFYMIDGFRYAMVGTASVSPVMGATVLPLTLLLLGGCAFLMLKSGYKLKS